MVNIKFSEQIKKISDSLTLKINTKTRFLESNGKKVINLSAGEPDLDTPEIVKQRAKEAIDRGYTKYTPVSGIKQLKEAITKRYRDKYEIDLSDDCVLISSGAKQAIFNIIATLCGPGDEVIIPVPYWVSYPEVVKLCLAKPVFVDTSQTEFMLTPESLDTAITEKTKLLMFNSPCNPTGIVYPVDIVKEIASIVKKRNIFCISDEIYDELIYVNKRYKTVLSLSNTSLDNFIVVNGVSKTFSMTGWRLGFAIANKSIVTNAAKIQAHTTSCASSISQYAALAALNEAKPFINKIRNIFDERRKLVKTMLSEMEDVSFPEPEGAFYLFFNISKFYNNNKKTSIEMADYLLDKYCVAVVSGAAFGDDRYLRLSYTLPIKSLTEGITRIKNGLLNVCR